MIFEFRNLIQSQHNLYLKSLWMKYVPDKERKKGRNNWFQTDGWRDWSLNGTFKMKFLYIVYIIRIKSTTSYTCLSQIQNDCSTKLYRLFIYHNKITYNERTSSAYNKY